jgi:AraC-like DNA-binding protein
VRGQPQRRVRPRASCVPPASTAERRHPRICGLCRADLAGRTIFFLKFQGRRSRASPLPQRVLRRVKDRIDAELAGDLTLSILAEESGYSRTHFQRMFRTATGLTPHQYLLERRLGRAQELLEMRNADLIDVAASCGFSSHSHMTTVFRRLLGMTPAEYRRNRRRSI